jgi:biopolymer transport protein ExbD
LYSGVATFAGAEHLGHRRATNLERRHMAMQTSELKQGEPTSEINTTPLIDVMLVLLIMLIVTLPTQSHSIPVDTPQGSETTPVIPSPEPIHISLDFDGSLLWNGAPMDVADLDRRLAAEARRMPQPEIHVEPHRLVKYGQVAHVMAAAQREGLTKLGVLGGT